MTTKRDNSKKQWSRKEADEVIRQLATMKGNELRRLWEDVFGGYCYSHRLSFVRRRLEWRINTLVSGGLSERALKRAEEIMDDTLLRLKARRFRERQAPTPRRTICKIYHGEKHEVDDYGDYWIYREQRFDTLSAVATHITGYHASGSKFFGVYVKKDKQR